MAAIVEGLSFCLWEMPVPMVYATHRIIRDCNEEFASLFRYARSGHCNVNPRVFTRQSLKALSSGFQAGNLTPHVCGGLAQLTVVG